MVRRRAAPVMCNIGAIRSDSRRRCGWLAVEHDVPQSRPPRRLGPVLERGKGYWYPEVQQCDTTLEVNDGAARFNADDGFLVGFPEHVWPALYAFRTSIKASVGLEVRFDKMHAYIADMEAARREAPADIEWPELDGHHGIAVLNVPLGSPEYVQAYMRGKAEELREEVDASLSKLLSAKPSRR
eukprot:jgi/Tetstr1/445785/TSEL_033432.t1